jgi:hypothetical protein
MHVLCSKVDQPVTLAAISTFHDPSCPVLPPHPTRVRILDPFSTLLSKHTRRRQGKTLFHILLLTRCHSPDEILTILQRQIPSSDQSQGGHEGFAKCLIPTVNVLYAFSAALGEGVGLVRVAPSSLLRTSICTLTLVSGVLTGKSSFCWHLRSPLG